MDDKKNFALSLVATAPSPATSGTSLTVTAGQGAWFPTPPFQLTVWPAGSNPTPSNAEIVRVTARSTDTFTITRTQEGTSARSIVVGDQVAHTLTAGMMLETQTLQGRRATGAMWTDCMANSTGAIAPFLITAISSGTTSVPSGSVDPNHPGVVRVTSSTTANSGQWFGTANTSLRLAAGDYMETVLKIVTLTNTTIRLGFHDSQTSADAVDGAYFEILNTGVCTFKTANNSTRTSAGTTATLSTATWYRFEVEVKSTTDVRGRIYNADTGAVVLAEQTITTNIPSTSGRECGVTITGTNSTTTSTALYEVDWIGYEKRPGFDTVR